MYTFSPMMVANSRKHHCRVRPYTREVLVFSTNLEIQTKHYSLVFKIRKGDEARTKKTWNSGSATDWDSSYNCKEFRHVARECQKLKRAQDSAYHKEKMLMYDEPEDQEFEAHYMYMAKIQEVTPDAADNSGPIFDDEPLQKVHSSDDNYNVFANERQHPEQPKYVNDTYLVEQGDTNIIHDSSYMSNNGEEADQDDQML
ncbi:hypothetical protein Tco_0569903 [Tanacetum coccineum]